MKLKFNLLAGAALLSVVSLSSWAQSVVISRPPVPNGSNGSRAPLPENRPSEYSRASSDEAWGGNSTLAARHIGGQSSKQIAATLPAGLQNAPASVGTQDAVPAVTTIAVVPAAVTPIIVVAQPVVAAGPALNAVQMGSQLRSEATASREQLLEIESRVAVSDQAMATTRGTMAALSAENQTQFDTANDDVKAKERTLRQSIKAARNTSGEQVALDYEAYAAAVARVDVIAASDR